ncbi:hypothetical protein CERSUDRAFT_78307 [Gelatoporia subvermispora B]|uniref:AB hydrolase-1 domain-containing protein n=1 Tax=Ceriporiopsis subvermispora (strain B) TaxID=914234 RepID=M2Q354_CERS8|nr:hypothetical protein CERSUDRAFT_78307 [Gelatoporia subvermispora B]
MIISSVTFTYPDAKPCGLQVAAKRYSKPHSLPDGLTLILAHGATCHKELWEPVLDSLLKSEYRGTPIVREAWALDWQSHGESATLNHNLLACDPQGPSVEEWGKAIRHFVLSETFTGHRLVAIGHCLGSSALIFSAMPDCPYEAFVNVEGMWISPTVYHQNIDACNAMKIRTYATATDRRDTWNSREEAFACLINTMPYKEWDQRAFERYVNYGLRDVIDPDGGLSYVTNACSKAHLAEAILNHGPQLVSFGYCLDMDPQFPFHIIFGERPRFVHDSVLESRSYSSVSRVPNAGHGAVLQNPDGVSACLEKILLDTIRGESPFKL